MSWCVNVDALVASPKLAERDRYFAQAVHFKVFHNKLLNVSEIRKTNLIHIRCFDFWKISQALFTLGCKHQSFIIFMKRLIGLIEIFLNGFNELIHLHLH